MPAASTTEQIQEDYENSERIPQHVEIMVQEGAFHDNCGGSRKQPYGRTCRVKKMGQCLRPS